MNMIATIEAEEAARLSATATKVPEFQPGDTVIVNVKGDGRATAPAFRLTKASASPATAAASTRASPSARSPTARAWSACSRSTRR